MDRLKKAAQKRNYQRAYRERKRDDRMQCWLHARQIVTTSAFYKEVLEEVEYMHKKYELQERRRKATVEDDFVYSWNVHVCKRSPTPIAVGSLGEPVDAVDMLMAVFTKEEREQFDV